MMLPDDPADRYAVIASGFGDLIADTRDWSAPAPVDGWTARDVVWHLVDWFPGLMRVGASIELPLRDRDGFDPARDWVTLDQAVRSMFADPAMVSAEFSHPQAGTMTIGQAIDMFYTPDVFMHSWDLATAGGIPIELDPDYCASLLAGMEGIDELLRSSGQYGPKVDVDENVDPMLRLMGFIGRDPNWSPPLVH
jgi:uncharacterized protein (TIGR03086 family)